jgi:hypothetical protein
MAADDGKVVNDRAIAQDILARGHPDGLLVARIGDDPVEQRNLNGVFIMLLIGVKDGTKDVLCAAVDAGE